MCLNEFDEFYEFAIFIYKLKFLGDTFPLLVFFNLLCHVIHTYIMEQFIRYGLELTQKLLLGQTTGDKNNAKNAKIQYKEGRKGINKAGITN